MRRFHRANVSALSLLLAAAPASAQSAENSWRFSVDGRAFAQYMQSTTEAGARAFGSANWFMAGLAYQGARSAVDLEVMGSAEPLTLGECGYPRLLTPGFLCFENVLEDRAHAHPLIMSLGVSFSYAWSENNRARLSAGPVGEPAFGPTAYYHRASAQFDPITPLTQELLNPAHASYGVVTAAFSSARTRWEASAFNGGARDRNLYNFDMAPLHSYSGRATAQLSESVSGQISFASFQPSEGGSAHGGHGGGSGRMRAWSASLQHLTGNSENGSAALLGWAAHHVDGEIMHAGLLEAQFTRAGNTLFGRAEIAGRVDQEIQVAILEDGTHVHVILPRRYRVSELVAGYARRLGGWKGIDLDIGGRASLTPIPAYIRPRYLDSRGFAFAVFSRVAVQPRAAASHHHD